MKLDKLESHCAKSPASSRNASTPGHHGVAGLVGTK
jgi:hypothetical protein